jgi:hypothetical protein
VHVVGHHLPGDDLPSVFSAATSSSTSFNRASDMPTTAYKPAVTLE